MEDALQALQLRRITEDLGRELPAVDLPVLAQDLRAEGLHDRGVPNRPAQLLVADHRVGVQDLRAELPEHRPDHRLSRPHRPGEPDDERGHGSLSFAHSSYSPRKSRSSDAYSSLTCRVSR